MNNELQTTLAHALGVVKTNNPEFKPAVAMTDYCGAEVSAFKITWPPESAGSTNGHFKTEILKPKY